MRKSEKPTLTRIILFGYHVDLLKAFYMDYFDLSLVEEIAGQWIVLNAGSVEIALHKIGKEYEPKSGTAFRAESNTKLVFQISEPLAGFRQRLADRGVDIGPVKQFEGIDSLFCDGVDPEGNVFQVEQKLIGN